MLVIITIILLILILYLTCNKMEPYTCCDGGDRYINYYQNKKPFENEQRFGNDLVYELNK